MVVSRVFQTFLRDFVFSIRGPIAAHRVRPGRNDDARLSAVARQKIRGSRQGAKNAKTPLVFLAFPAPWRDTIFPALNDPHLLSESELIVWKARTHFLQEIFCSAPIGWLGAVTPRRSLPTRPDREGRAVRLAGPTPRRKPHPERRSGLSIV